MKGPGSILRIVVKDWYLGSGSRIVIKAGDQ